MRSFARIAVFVAIALATAWVLYVNLFHPPRGTWGVNTRFYPQLQMQRIGGNLPSFSFRVETIVPRSPAARAGIVPGDVLRFFVAYPFGVSHPPRDARARVLIRHGNVQRDVILSSATVPPPQLGMSQMSLFLLQLIELGLAILLAWKCWEKPEAQALIVYFVAHAATMAPTLWLYPSVGFEMPLHALLNFVAYAGLVYFAASYPQGSVKTRLRNALAVYGPLASIALGAVVFVNLAVSYWLGPSIDLSSLYEYGQVFFGTILPATGLIAGALAAASPDRTRMRILVTFFLAGSCGPIVFDILSSLGATYDVTRPLLCTLLVADAGFVYVILRHRLFDLGFVLNRAAVYAVLTTIFVPLFALLEWLAERFILSQNRTANALVQVGIALVLFMSIRRVHAVTERFVDDWLFRERHENDQALRDFARQVLFITDFRTIADRTVQTVCTRTHAAWSALYVRQAATGAYDLTAACGDPDAPATMPENDPALVAMRTDHQAVDHVKGSEIAEALVLPLFARGRVDGFLACGGKRTGEFYAPDERDALVQVTHGVAAAFDGVRLTELEREVARLRGSLASA